MTERAQVALALGRHLEVVGDLEPVVAHDPTLESLAGLLMLALYRSGRQADALDVYTRTREVLDESLGLEPSVSLRSLHERVLRQDATLGAQQDMVPAAASTARQPVEDARSGGCSGGWAHDCSGHDAGAPVPRRRGPDGADEPAHRGPAADRPRRPAGLHRRAPRRRTAAVPHRPRRRREDVPGARHRRPRVGELPGRRLRGAAGVGQHRRPGAGRGRRRPRHADGRRRRDPRPPRPAHLVPDPAPHAAAGRQLRARRRRRRRPHRRHPQPLPRRHRPRHQPRSARRPRRGAGHRRPVGDATGGHPARRGAQLPGGAAVRRTGPRRAPRAGVRRRQPDRDRCHHPVPRRHPARPRARRRPGVDAVAGRGVPAAREPVHPAHLRRPHRRGAAADAARHRRLELPAAVGDRATGVRPALGLPGRLDADVGRGRRRRRGHTPRRGPRHHRPARRTVHGRRRTRPHQPVPDAGDAASVRRRTAPGVRAGGRGGAPPRRLLPRASSSTPRSRCAGTSNGRRCGCCATSNPTSAPPWRSSAAPTATATPP